MSFLTVEDVDAARLGLTREPAERLRRETMVMHPEPMNRGVEISPSMADGPRSLGLRQVTNGIAGRMAILFDALSGRGEGGTE